MFLAIEIGGTKLQLGVGAGDGGPLIALEREDVQPQLGAEGICRQIQQLGKLLVRRHGITAIGIGFGGPVDTARGRTLLSHHVEGWNDFPLADWCREKLGVPAAVANDSDMAGVAEARFGAGQGHRIVFYSNVGTGIGGALVIGGELYRGSSGVASELGHLRPGLDFDRPDRTLESLAAGWGITAAVRSRLDRSQDVSPEVASDLSRRCGGRLDRLTTRMVAEAATEGNRLAREVFDRACQAYGWALAQMITLVAPNVVVVGGGVSLAGEELWLDPLRTHVARYAFPPLADSFQIVPAALGEEVVLHARWPLAAQQKGR